MLKKMLMLFIAVALVLAGCGSSDKSASNAGSNSGSSVNTGSINTGSTDEAQEENDASNLPPYEIVIAFPTSSSQTSGIPEVEQAINEITKKKINATIKLMPYSYASYAQQLNLMFASNEKLDLFVSGVNGAYSSQVAQGSMIPLDDLLEKYGSGIKEAVYAPFIEAARMNGKLYGIPSNRDLAADRELLMRKDIVDKYHIDLSQVKTFEDFGQIFKVVKENEPDLIPLVLFTQISTPVDVIASMYFDILGDRMGVLEYGNSEMKVVNMYETEQYAQLLNTVRSWYEKGYVQKDAATTKDTGPVLVQAGRAFSYIKQSKPGSDTQASRQTGYEMVSLKLPPAYSTTNLITQFLWSIAKNSQDPERAMMFLNLMFTDTDIINLLAWGIEGRDYVKVSGNIIDYPEGVNATNVPYGLNQGWLFGNQFKSYVFKGDPEDIYQQTDQFNKEAVKSPALGFTFDSTPVKSEVASVTNVMNQYRLGLETGSLDPETLLPQYFSEMKKAGIDRIIEEKQRQLDEWVKTK
ncbi:ABC transporter substrate-binding protein [Cohnella laeviribosi]|uniref:ABC transporter substrate-binding protein n=1 Tax=Cohnella laeviribosi TaxID=380174 RepID=UPI00037557C4|nr:ABC transporter substrate-binding protein [Cohnella laeviribosi]